MLVGDPTVGRATENSWVNDFCRTLPLAPASSESSNSDSSAVWLLGTADLDGSVRNELSCVDGSSDSAIGRLSSPIIVGVYLLAMEDMLVVRLFQHKVDDYNASLLMFTFRTQYVMV